MQGPHLPSLNTVGDFSLVSQSKDLEMKARVPSIAPSSGKGEPTFPRISIWLSRGFLRPFPAPSQHPHLSLELT